MSDSIDRRIRDPDEAKVCLSPSGKYRLGFDSYGTLNHPNWRIAEIIVTDVRHDKVVHRFLRNDDWDFFKWVTKDGKEYLLCSEDYEGQGVLDPSSGRYESYSEDDGFIWVDFHLSPDGNFLAIDGCHWACPNQVVIYDFSDPMNLPLPKILECWGDHNIAFEEWIDGKAFRLSAPFKESCIHRLP